MICGYKKANSMVLFYKFMEQDLPEFCPRCNTKGFIYLKVFTEYIRFVCQSCDTKWKIVLDKDDDIVDVILID